MGQSPLLQKQNQKDVRGLPADITEICYEKHQVKTFLDHSIFQEPLEKFHFKNNFVARHGGSSILVA